MKRLPIAVGLLLLTVLLCVGEHWLLEQHTDRLLERLDRTVEAVSAQQTDASQQLETFCRAFENDTRWFPYFLPHSSLDDVEDSVARLQGLPITASPQLLEELSLCRHQISHLRQSVQLTLKNVF